MAERGGGPSVGAQSGEQGASHEGQGDTEQYVQLEFKESGLPESVEGGRVPAANEAPRAESATLVEQRQPGDGSDGGGEGRKSVFSLRYWQEYFDVDTIDVGKKLVHAVVMPFKRDFLEKHGEKPDMYGPFWVAATLIFFSAAMGSVAAFSQGQADPGRPGSKRVGLGAFVFFGYIFQMPCIVKLVSRYLLGASELPRLDSLICLYGYAMAIYIPVSALCVVPSDGFRWAIVMFAAVWSATFLAVSYDKASTALVGGRRVIASVIVFGSHVLLAVAFKMYFFAYA